ncbi:MAG TPA: ASCH domain-containing protein [Mycobacterium sp.]|jgi:hypothetical protein|nr:ASCH domain-containing protein [Mycobacterium sp.]
MCDQMRPKSYVDKPLVKPEPVTADDLRPAAEGRQDLSDAPSMANTSDSPLTPDVRPSTNSPRRFGQLPSLKVPDNFDDPLPDAETAAREVDSPSYAGDVANQDVGSASLRGLLVRDPYASRLLDGEKIWEIRGRSTHIRGPILIIKSGTGQVFGTADLVRVLGPLELEDLVDASELPRQEREEFRRSGLPYPKTYAYVFSNPRRFNRPIPYRHPSGAVTWVRLPDVDLGAVRYASSPHGASEGDLLHVLATEIWPLLERILGDPTAT